MSVRAGRCRKSSDDKMPSEIVQTAFLFSLRHFVAVVHKQILRRKTAYPIFGIAVEHGGIMGFVAVQFPLDGADVQIETLSARQAFAAENRVFTPLTCANFAASVMV